MPFRDLADANRLARAVLRRQFDHRNAGVFCFRREYSFNLSPIHLIIGATLPKQSRLGRGWNEFHSSNSIKVSKVNNHSFPRDLTPGPASLNMDLLDTFPGGMSMTEKAYLAVDMGASSGRPCWDCSTASSLQLEEVYRFDNGPVEVAGRLYWDLLGQWSHVRQGLRAAGAPMRQHHRQRRR